MTRQLEQLIPTVHEVKGFVGLVKIPPQRVTLYLGHETEQIAQIAQQSFGDLPANLTWRRVR
jgi:hypothetical protein